MGYVHPPKEKVREYLARRTHETEPPPTPEEIRRELGWELVARDKPSTDRNE